MIVLDASIMLAWLFREQALASRPQIEISLAQETLLVPAHWPAEIGNALVVNVRRGRISENDLRRMVESLQTFAVSPQAPPETEHFETLVRFAQMHRLTFYDALYVQLALETESVLATLDEDMRKTASQLGLELLPA